MRENNKINIVPLGEVADIIAGQSPPSTSYNFENKGIPFFQGKADFGEVYPSVRVWCDEPTKIALPNDILMSVRAPVGPTNLCNVKSCIGRGLTAIRIDSRNCYKYVFYYLRSIENKLLNLGRGSTFTAITQEDLKLIKIPLPTKENQVYLSDLLDKASLLIRKRQQTIKLADEFLRSTFLEMFGEGQFRMAKLQTVATKITDGVHSRPEYALDGVPFISVKDITKGYLDLSDCKYISEEDHKNYYNRCNPEYYDVLYTKVGATYGRAALVDTKQKFSLYVSVCLIKPNNDVINPLYLKELLNSQIVKKQADKCIKGIGVPDLHLIEIKNFEVPIPPISIQNRFAEIYSSLTLLKNKLKISLIEMENQFNSLMQKAFRRDLLII